MTGWLIYRKSDARRNHHAIEYYRSACKRREVQICLRYFENFSWGTAEESLYLAYNGQPETVPPDFVIMRADVPVFSAHLEGLGYRVFNNARLSTVANDKLQTLQLAATLGIPTPVTRLGTKTDALLLGAELGYPLVIKPRDGHGGQDVMWVQDVDALQALLPQYQHETFLLQRPVSALGRDLRVYVVGGRVVAAMLRSCDNDFRSNYCLGGHARRYELSAAETQIVSRLTTAVSMDFVGIDFLFHDGQPILGEIEDVVGARMLYHLTDIDVVDQYVAHILAQLP